MPDWWVTGWLAGLTVFLLLLYLLMYLLLRWGQKQVDEMRERPMTIDEIRRLPP